MQEDQIITRETIVKSKLGMHARPASQIAQLAETASADVWLYIDDQKVDATSIIDILATCAVSGTKVRVEIENKEDIKILDEIISLFESGFGEPMTDEFA